MGTQRPQSAQNHILLCGLCRPRVQTSCGCYHTRLATRVGDAESVALRVSFSGWGRKGRKARKTISCFADSAGLAFKRLVVATTLGSQRVSATLKASPYECPSPDGDAKAAKRAKPYLALRTLPASRSNVLWLLPHSARNACRRR